MPYFDELQQASFNGLPFPVSELRVEGGLRDHEHEYPHAPGADAEKLGRKLYKIQMVCPFHATFRKYPAIYPQGLDTLQGFFDQETTADLVIPTIGTIKAYAKTWVRTASAKARSGETVQLLFTEDQSQLFLTNELIDTTAATLASNASTFDAQAALEQFQQPVTLGLLDAFQEAVTSVLAIQDTQEAVSNLMAAKLAALVSDAQALDRCAEMQDPSHALLIGYLHDLWDSAQRQAQNLNQSSASPLIYTVRSLCSITQVSAAIFDGDSTHAVELLQMNPIEDAFAIPAGTPITYIPALAAAA